jgi:hypothetical protein
MVPDADRTQLNVRYCKLLNKLIADEKIPRTSGSFPDGVGSPANSNHSLQVKNAAGEVHIIHISIEPSGKLAAVSIIPPGPEAPLPQAKELGLKLPEVSRLSKDSPWKTIQKLFENKQDARSFRNELTQRMEEYGHSARQATEIAEVLAELRDVPGIEAYLESLVSHSESTAAGALWELRWAFKNKDLIQEMQILEVVEDRVRDGADFILRDNTVVEVKAYNWKAKPYKDPNIIDSVARRWADQLGRRAETYPDSKLRLVVVDKADIPRGTDEMTLEKLVFQELEKLKKKEYPNINLGRLSIENFDSK